MRLAAGEFYDGPLKTICGAVRLLGYDKKPTGAKSWKDLAGKGATDKQLETNLAHLRNRDHGDWWLETVHGGHGSRDRLDWTFSRDQLIRPDEPYTRRQVVLRGRSAILTAVRRLFAIGLAAKSSGNGKPPAKKPPTARRKKKIAKKKSSTAAKPAEPRFPLAVNYDGPPPKLSKSKKNKPAPQLVGAGMTADGHPDAGELMDFAERGMAAQSAVDDQIEKAAARARKPR